VKVITEAILRDELKTEKPESYVIPEGKIISPSAREYLLQNRIKIVKASEEKTNKKIIKNEMVKPPQRNNGERFETTGTKYQDFESGAYYFEKPEHMTQLFDNQLVAKNHKRISFRGKLDSLQSLFVLNQAILLEMGESQKLIDDLDDILSGLREIMRCDVLNEDFHKELLIGLTHDELRAHSHNPMKYYKIKQMVLPNYTLGKAYALLNQLRTAIRETEVVAVGAFQVENTYERSDLIQELNRMSSALHIMMCKYLAAEYKH